MDHLVIYNGELMSEASPVLGPSNRGFRYGDSLFESIRIVNGVPQFMSNHYNRLEEGMKVLRMKPPASFSLSYFEQQLKSLIQKNGVKEGGRARLTVFRNRGGFYQPHDNSVSFLLEAQPYFENEYALNEEGLNIDIYQDIKKSVNKLSTFKTGSCLPYIMAGLHCQDNNLDECLLISDRGNIIEAISSNIFIVSNGVLYTPPLEDGCVGGTMRMNIINLALSNNIKVYESSLTPQNLLAADEIFLTNAIRGIQWVSSYKMKRYYHKISKELVALLNANVANLKLDLQGNS